MLRAVSPAVILLLGSACSIETGPRMGAEQLYREALLGWCAKEIGDQEIIPTQIGGYSESFWRRSESDGVIIYSVNTDTRPTHYVNIVVNEAYNDCTVLGPPHDNRFAEALRSEVAGLPYEVTEVSLPPVRSNGTRSAYHISQRGLTIEIENFPMIDGSPSVVSRVTRLGAQEALN